MARRKGETTAREIERRYPHLVAIAVPETGISNLLEIYAAAERIGGDNRPGRRRRVDDREFATWCFETAEQAAEFAGLFGGEVLTAHKGE